MSISVLLVDDEKLERVLLRKGFDWEKYGLNIIGESDNGVEALEFIAHRRPDIIFTDINMPHMDGLALTESIMKQYPDSYVVIVTGFREFEYARRAVKLGVEDFLLKPVNMKDIEEIVRKITRKIDEEKANKEKVTELTNSILADRDIVIESFLQRLVERRITDEKAKRKLESYGFEWLEQECMAINIRIQPADQINGEKCKEIIEAYLKEYDNNSISFMHYMKNLVILTQGSDAKQIHVLTNEIQERIKAAGIRVSMGISRNSQGIQGISQAYNDSQKALSTSILFEEDRIVTYEEYSSILKRNKTALSMNWQEFIFAVSNCMKDRVNESIKEYTDNIRNTNITDIEYLKLVTLNMLHKASSIMNKYGTSIFEHAGEDRVYEGVMNIRNVNDIEVFLKEYIGIIMQFMGTKLEKKGNKVVEESLQYIEKNLFEPELTLKTVAGSIFTNESYLSRTFKKETGESLIEYITRKRIEESVSLLNTTDLKVYEIAERVGFRDSHYFSICFKKQQGITIKEFRQEQKTVGEDMVV